MYPAVFPLTLIQRDIYFDQLHSPGNPRYNVGGYIRFDHVDVSRLMHAHARLVAMHDVLGIRIRSDASGVWQYVSDERTTLLPIHDFSDEADPRVVASAWLGAQFEQPLPIDEKELFRACLLNLGTEQWYVAIAHHLVMDGLGFANWARCLHEAYLGSATPGCDAPLRWADIVAKDVEYSNGSRYRADREFWLGHCQPLPESLCSPFHLSTLQPEERAKSGRVVLDIPADRYAPLVQLARECGVSVPHVFLGAITTYFALTRGRKRLALGVPAHNRSSHAQKQMLGVFTSMSPLCVDFDEHWTFRHLITQIAQLLKRSFKHQRYPLGDLIRDLGIAAGTRPLYDVLFSYLKVDAQSNLDASGARPVYVGHNHEATPLMVTVWEYGEAESAQVLIDHNLAYYSSAEASLLAERIACILERLARAPDRSVAQTDLLVPSERRQVLYEFNRTRDEYPTDRCIHELFEEQVRRVPDAVAVTSGVRSLSYRELNERANRLAHCLIDKGLKPGGLVGLCVERSLDMVVGMLAILKAGGAYVPLDPSYPKARLEAILEDSAVQIVLTQSALGEMATVRAAQSVLLEDVDSLAAYPRHDPDPLSLGLQSSDRAYVIYTSGSTGQPKGVEICHRNTVALLFWARNVFPACELARVLASTSLNFDLSIFEIFVPLAFGYECVVVKDALTLLQERVDVTLINTVPSAAKVLLDHHAISGSVRVVNLAGEALSASIVNRLLESTRCEKVYNCYGPSEDTTYSTYACFEKPLNGIASIGRPVANTCVYVLSESRKLLPVGEVGELFIGGAGLARGYLNRPQLTAERFISNPFRDDEQAAIQSERLYRTGDLARWRPDGVLDFFGRNDHQVKIRGFRIELGEIEHALTTHECVREAVVLARESASGDKRLVAYVATNTVHHDLAIHRDLVAQLTRHLKASLPDSMIPAVFMLLERLPLNPNGKVDRSALPEPDVSEQQAAFVAPRTETERILCEVWHEVLGVAQVGVTDNFFQLGGNSLLAIEVIAQLQRRGIEAPARELFATPTLADLAAFIDEAKRLRRTGKESGAAQAVPGNLIPTGCEHITPEMLPLVSLGADDIDRIVTQLPGGARNVQDMYPLGPLQEGILFHHMASAHGDPYVLCAVCRIDGRQVLDEFLHGLQFVVDRHDALRTAILWRNLSSPIQVVLRNAVLPVSWIEPEPGQDMAECVRALCSPEAQRIEVSEAPLLRVQVAHDPQTAHYLVVLRLHHIVSDHVGLEIIQRELSMHRLGRADQLPGPAPYRNFIAYAQRNTDGGEATKYFQRILGDVETPTTPFNLTEARGDGSRLVELKQAVPAATATQIRRVARNMRISPAALFHAAWAIVVGSCSARDDVVFGTIVSGRLQGTPGADSMLGVFINTLPLRVKMKGLTAAGLVRQVHGSLLELVSYEHASLAVAQRCAGVPAGSALFTALLNYRHSSHGGVTSRHADGEAHPSEAAGDAAHAAFEYLGSQERSNYPFTLSVDDMGDEFHFVVQVDASLSAARIAEYVKLAIERLSDALPGAGERPLAEIDILPLAERHRLVVEWNDTASEIPRDKCVHEIFEARVQLDPGALAVADGVRQWTYLQLNARANQLARHLLAHGVREGEHVAIMLERSADLIAAQLAILKAGAIYVPLDAALPAQRQAFILTDCAARWVLTRGDVRITPDSAAQCLAIDDESLASLGTDNLGISPGAGAVACVFYTSGSTGEPKGVRLAHQSLVRLALNNGYLDVQREDRVAFAANPAFDASSIEVWTTILNGAASVVVPPSVVLEPQRLSETLRHHSVTALFLTTALFNQYLTGYPDLFRSLRYVMFGGEQSDPLTGARWSNAGLTAQLLHLYGPAECTTLATSYRVNEPVPGVGSVPIGRAIANTQIYLLDSELRLVPTGVPGEIYVGGLGVARGYLNRSELTAERFLPDRFGAEADAKWYRTGDMGRWLPDGNIEFLGRNDGQVKVRGFRIELEEIEAQLRRHAQVQEAIVVARESSGQKLLVAYFSRSGPDAPDAEDLRAYLNQRLPAYMIPVAFFLMNQWPLTANGKVDRKALPQLQEAAFCRQTYEEPRGDAECKLASVWQELLGVERVGRTDNFFALGGNSLLVVRLKMALQRRFNLDLPIRELFEHSQMEDQARLLPGKVDAPAQEPLVAVTRAGSALPLSFAQQRLWFIDQLEPGNSQYNITAAFRIRGELDSRALQQALDAIVARHEVLRTVYETLPTGEPVQRAESAQQSAVMWFDLSELTADAQPARLTQLIEAEAGKPFDLRGDLMLRAGLVTLGTDDHALLLTLHHIAVDGWSVRVLVRELVALYAAYARGAQNPLEPLPIQYADYAYHQRQVLSPVALEPHLRYWRQYLAGAPHHHNLPLDHARPSQRDFRGRVYLQRFPQPISTAIKDFARVHDATVFMVLQTAFAVLLARWSGQADIVMSVPVAGRIHHQTEPLIGLFVNTLASRSVIDLGKSFEALLAETRASLVAGLAHQELPFEQLLEALQPERRLSTAPLSQIAFSMQDDELAALELPGLQIVPLPQESTPLKHDLELTARLTGEGLLLSWSYAASLFEQSTIERIAGAMATLLSAIVALPTRCVGELPVVCAEDLALQAQWAARCSEVDGYVGQVVDHAGRPLPAGAVGEWAGELVRWSFDGRLEHWGRVEEQISAGGLTFSPGQVAQTLLRHPRVADACVVRQDLDEGVRMAAYVVSDSHSKSDVRDGSFEHSLRGWLHEQLPAPMQPRALSLVPVLPRQADGSIDEQALPEPSWMSTDAYAVPQTREEIGLASVWQSLLGVEQIGLADNFFVLGGNSLTAVRLEFAIQERFGIAISIRELFERPQLGTQALLIAARAKAPGRRMLPEIVPVSRDGGPLPLSFAQQRLWLIDRIDSGSAHYNMPAAFALSGELNLEALNRAFSEMIERHETLRTRFVEGTDGEPVQVIQLHTEFTIAVQDISNLEQGSRQLRMAELIAAEAARKFDLSRDLPLRVELVKLADRESVLLATLHHIAADGWSVAIMIDEFAALYGASVRGEASSLPPLRIQYADYAYWQRQWVQGDVLEEQLAYWQRQLAGIPVVHGLQTDHPRPKQQSFNGNTWRSRIDAQLTGKLTQLCQRHGASLFMGLHAAFAAFLARYGNESDIVIGTAVANRDQGATAGLIGFFVNTVVLRSDLSGTPSFVEVLGRSRRTLLDAYAHQQVPFDLVVERLQPRRSLDHSPLFQVMLVLQNNAAGSLELPGLVLTPLEVATGVAKYDLTLEVREDAQGLALNWEYNTDLFDAGTVTRMANHFNMLLAAVLGAPDEDLFRAAMLGADERRMLLVEQNGTATDYPWRRCMHELFEAQVQADPEAICVVLEGRRWTYCELNCRANQLARYLVSERQVRPGTMIGLCLDRSFEMLVALLGVMKAGGAYVPLDPAHPAARLAYMIEDANLRVVITRQSLLERVPMEAAQAVCLDTGDLQLRLAGQAIDNLLPAQLGLTSNDLAYVLYTSGSTGKPKGVCVVHSALTNYLNYIGARYFANVEGAVVSSPLAFDATITSLLGPLTVGKWVELLPSTGWEVEQLALRLQSEGRATLFKITPAHLEALASLLPQSADSTEAVSLVPHWLVVGGEQLSTHLARMWKCRLLPNATLVNEYGPTETVVGCSVFFVDDPNCLPGERAVVPIGRPIDNTQLLVLNPSGALVPVGVPGELYIGGAGMARGYLNRPQLTREKFVTSAHYDPDQSNSSERLYRTGDLVRWLCDGNLEFLGRIDRQVKIHGMRIELGEIEHALRAASAVIRDAVVIVQEAVNGDRRLVAYVTTTDSWAALDTQARGGFMDLLRRSLGESLPEYLIPSAFMLLDQLPLTPNGKLDRGALPAPDWTSRKADRVAPRTPAEEVLCALWRDVLGIEHVGVTDNFFELGGNSLSLTRLAARINREFGLRLSLAELFQAQTIEQVAQRIASGEAIERMQLDRAETLAPNELEMTI